MQICYQYLERIYCIVLETQWPNIRVLYRERNSSFRYRTDNKLCA